MELAILAIVLLTGVFIGLLIGIATQFKGFSVNVNHNHSYPEVPEEPEQYNQSYGDPTIKNYLDKQFGGVNND